MLTIIVFHAHNGMISKYVSDFLHPWSVPVFFIIAGFFLKLESMDAPISFMKKKIKTLYIPATIIYIIAVLMHNVFVDLNWYKLGELHPGTKVPFGYYGVKDTIIGCVKALCCVGSGELIMGAMWFLYTLLYAFVGLCLVRYLTNKVKSFKGMGGVILLFGAIISCVLTQKFDFTISRVNITVTAMLLIYIGVYINQHIRLKFDNLVVFLICLLFFIQCVLLQHITIVLAKNCYQDLFQLCIGSCCAVYVLGYSAKKIENTLIGDFLSLLGRESLYLMALHIFGFFICSSVLWKVGLVSANGSHGMYTYCREGNWGVLFLYVLFGLFVPLTTVFVIRQIKKGVIYLLSAKRI